MAPLWGTSFWLSTMVGGFLRDTFTFVGGINHPTITSCDHWRSCLCRAPIVCLTILGEKFQLDVLGLNCLPRVIVLDAVINLVEVILMTV